MQHRKGLKPLEGQQKKLKNRGSDKIDHKRRHQNHTANMLSLISTTLTKFLRVITNGLLHRQQPLPPFFPDDLIFQILLLLPVRSLLQFKCVCKSWKTLISDPQFAKAHLWSLTVNPTLIHQRLFYLNNEHIIVSIPVKPLLESPSKPTKLVEFTMEHKCCVLGSCNGLLCMINIDIQLWLWNPSIRLQSKKSPTLNSYGKPRTMSVKYYGFGYDHINDKYKVLLALYNDVTRIYTFGANSWTTIQDFPCRATKNEGKFVSGTLNWVIVETSVILSFDLEKETYKEVLLPEHDGFNVCNPVLGVSRNCLCVFFDSNGTHWDIWLMKKYGVVKSWTRLTMIPREQLKNHIQCAPCFSIEPLFIFGNSNVLFRTVTEFIMYNLNNGSLDFHPIYISSAQAIYFESLVSPQL